MPRRFLGSPDDFIGAAIVIFFGGPGSLIEEADQALIDHRFPHHLDAGQLADTGNDCMRVTAAAFDSTAPLRLCVTLLLGKQDSALLFHRFKTGPLDRISFTSYRDGDYDNECFFKMGELEQSVAVITGAATGIGRALAARLADEGAKLCLADINKEALDVVADALTAKGCDVSAYAVDVADRRQVETLCRNVVEQFGRADLLINNAGVALCGDIEEVSLSDIEWLMGINFWGTVYGVKYFLPILKQQKKAYIVNLSSVFGIIAPPGQAAYAASKFAVRGFTEALRHELVGTSVQVSSVHPGGIRTGIAKSSRLGAGTDPKKHERDAAMLDFLARTTPERAADRIVSGVLKGETRILIGFDASLIDMFQRLLPKRYWRLMGPLLEWRFSRANL